MFFYRMMKKRLEDTLGRKGKDPKEGELIIAVL